VIVNLVVNAMKFCGEEGDVRLTARADTQAKEVVVSVADNGPGIAPDELARIFDRFEQLNTDVRKSTKGFGLGLNIAQELVGLNLGKMDVESQLGGGSTFTFSIPLADAREVVKRYLHRVHARTKNSPSISLFSVRVEASTSPEDADDVDLFLNGLLRQNDLVWRLDTHRWLTVIAASEADVNRYVDRVKADREKINRHRPSGALPEFQVVLERTWRASDSPASLQHYFDTALAGRETAVC
jgi:hypothetical protein